MVKTSEMSMELKQELAFTKEELAELEAAKKMPIRTMLIPKEGCEFIVADFSAIEARVLAWEAGEQWVLDAF